MKVKINTEIKEFCKLLKLSTIGDEFEEVEQEASDYEDFLHRLLSLEIDARNQNSITRRVRLAHFPVRKQLDELEIDCLPKPMQKQIKALATLNFVRDGQNLIMTGNPGTGKSHIAIALGIKACEEGYKVLYTTIPLLITELKESKDANKLRNFQRRIEKYDLVIADELGYVSFDREGADLLFTCLSLRAINKSTIITSNLTFDRWDEVFGDPAITSAMVDRLTYKAILVDMTGDSYRLRETLRINGEEFDYLKGVNANETRETA